jgi:hypothetical protein
MTKKLSKKTTYLISSLATLILSATVAVAALTIGGTSVTSDGSMTLTAGGALSLTAGGTNQNITLTPSGTGSILTTANLAVGTTTATYLFTVATTSQIFSVSANGNVGVGVAPSVSTLLYINRDWGHPSGNRFGIYIDHGVTLTSAASRSVYGISADAYSDGNFNNTGSIVGGNFEAYAFSNNPVTNLYGSYSRTFSSYNSGSGGGATNAWGHYIEIDLEAPTNTTVYGIQVGPTRVNGATNYYGLRLGNPGSIIVAGPTNNYALYIDSQTGGVSSNYSIYSAGGTNYFAGNTGIGTAFPSSTLHVVAAASSTEYIGTASKSGCLAMGSASGTATLVYVWFDSDAAMYASTTKPVFCQ